MVIAKGKYLVGILRPKILYQSFIQFAIKKGALSLMT